METHYQEWTPAELQEIEGGHIMLAIGITTALYTFGHDACETY